MEGKYAMNAIDTSPKINPADLVSIHSRLTSDQSLMDSFEKNPGIFLGDRGLAVISNTADGQPVTLLESIEDAPQGTRFLTFDYLVSTILAEDGDGDGPAIEPRVFALGVNVLAIYNAGVIGNAVAYHDVLAGSEIFYGAVVWETAAYTGKAGFTPEDVQKRPNPKTIQLSNSYFESNLHSYLESKGLGVSRERMLLHAALQQDPIAGEKNNFIVKYAYRGADFKIAVTVDDQANRVTVTDGEIGY